jgi:hypothetical protein
MNKDYWQGTAVIIAALIAATVALYIHYHPNEPAPLSSSISEPSLSSVPQKPSESSESSVSESPAASSSSRPTYSSSVPVSSSTPAAPQKPGGYSESSGYVSSAVSSSTPAVSQKPSEAVESSIKESSVEPLPSSSSDTPVATTANTTVITTESLTSATKEAITAAKASGSKTASVRIKSAKSVSIKALKAMASTASASGLGAQLNADTMHGTSVSGRITINPAKATGSGDIQLGVYVDEEYVGDVQDKFEKWYQNDIRVISLAQSDSYGMPVYISAKLNFSGMDTRNLYFYSYNPSTNKYKRLTGTNAKIDQNSYIQFQTESANMIIISEEELDFSW